MPQNVNLKECEQEAYMYYHQDGLADIFIGLGILSFGLGMFIDQAWLFTLIPAIFLPLWQAAKKSITAPRMNNVEFPSAQYASVKKAIGFLVGMLALAMVAGIAVFWGQSTGNMPLWLLTWLTWLREYFMLAFGLFGAFLMSVSALLSGFNRLYAYAVLTVAVFAGGYLLNASLPLSVVLMGVMIFLSGLGLLIQFLRKYPRSD